MLLFIIFAPLEFNFVTVKKLIFPVLPTKNGAPFT